MNYNKKTVYDIDLKGKKVLCRFDFNVPQDKKTGETVLRAPYGKVKSWFLKKVPNYQEIDFSQPAVPASAEDNND